MSSERAGVHTPDDALDGIARAVRNWREGRTTHDEAGAADLVEDIEWFLDRAERAGAPTRDALDREAVLDAIRECAAPGMELRYDGSEDPVAAAYVAGVQTAHEAAKGALEACVVPDPRITRIEAELDRHERETRLTERGELHLRRLRTILRGDQ